MGKWEMFIIRLVLAVGIAILIGRFFLQGRSFWWTLLLAVVLLGLAYLQEYFRLRDRRGNP
ncbi:hypothetical protein [Desulfatiglans anilini]|uniref:hypothetical protein n=1 Tax=Desulfatiglans anilini TaxID=90728 RepID=UPI000420E109|nr:hypothetical protein [Desulfatiglans anilini]